MPPSQTPKNGARQSTPPPLTPREQEILTMIWSGLTSRQIGQRLVSASKPSIRIELR
jgi:DNA-binding NarL/FixJ family response regulator